MSCRAQVIKVIVGMRTCTAISLGVALLAMAEAPSAKSESGLLLTFKSLAGQVSEATTAPNLWLFVEAGKSPSPFLSAGPFSATWEGTLSAKLRSVFFFQAQLNGSLKLEINGATVLETNRSGGLKPLGKGVQLKKGLDSLT